MLDLKRLATTRLMQNCRKVKQAGKGHREEVKAFLDAVRGGRPCPISLDSLALTSAVTFRILDALRTGLPQALSA